MSASTTDCICRPREIWERDCPVHGVRVAQSASADMRCGDQVFNGSGRAIVCCREAGHEGAHWCHGDSWARTEPPVPVADETEALRAALDAAKDLYERVEMDESVGICLSERAPSLRFGDAITAADEALARVAGLEARKAALDAALVAMRARAVKEPLTVDISDYSDEFSAGFLAGQANALDEVLRRGIREC